MCPFVGCESEKNAPAFLHFAKFLTYEKDCQLLAADHARSHKVCFFRHLFYSVRGVCSFLLFMYKYCKSTQKSLYDLQTDP